MLNIILVVAYLIFSVAGILLMKAGNIIVLGEGNFFEHSINVNFLSIIGMVSYIVSFLLWVFIIPRFDLSYIVPLVLGISQVLILAGSYFIFNDMIDSTQLIGIIAIIAGVVLLNLN